MRNKSQLPELRAILDVARRSRGYAAGWNLRLELRRAESRKMNVPTMLRLDTKTHAKALADRVATLHDRLAVLGRDGHGKSREARRLRRQMATLKGQQKLLAGALHAPERKR